MTQRWLFHLWRCRNCWSSPPPWDVWSEQDLKQLSVEAVWLFRCLVSQETFRRWPLWGIGVGTVLPTTPPWATASMVEVHRTSCLLRAQRAWGPSRRDCPWKSCGAGPQTWGASAWASTSTWTLWSGLLWSASASGNKLWHRSWRWVTVAERETLRLEAQREKMSWIRRHGIACDDDIITLLSGVGN